MPLAGFWSETHSSWKCTFLSPWTTPETQLPPESNPDPSPRLERSRPPTALLGLGTLWSREGRLKWKGIWNGRAGSARHLGYLIYYYFGYWCNGNCIGMVRALARDREPQPCELKEAPEKCPTRSLQEVLGELVSQAVPRLSVHNIPQKQLLVDATR